MWSLLSPLSNNQTFYFLAHWFMVLETKFWKCKSNLAISVFLIIKKINLFLCLKSSPKCSDYSICVTLLMFFWVNISWLSKMVFFWGLNPYTFHYTAWCTVYVNNNWNLLKLWRKGKIILTPNLFLKYETFHLVSQCKKKCRNANGTINSYVYEIWKLVLSLETGIQLTIQSFQLTIQSFQKIAYNSLSIVVEAFHRQIEL